MATKKKPRNIQLRKLRPDDRIPYVPTQEIEPPSIDYIVEVPARTKKFSITIVSGQTSFRVVVPGLQK